MNILFAPAAGGTAGSIRTDIRKSRFYLPRVPHKDVRVRYLLTRQRILRSVFDDRRLPAS